MKSIAPSADGDVRSLYQLGAACGLMAVAVAIAQILIEVIGVGIARIAVPSTIEGWFALLQSNRPLGLTELTGLQIPMFALLIPFYLALYLALKSARPALTATGTAFALVGISVYLASNTAFSMLSLSDQWAAAGTEAQRSTFLAAGQAMLAIYDGPGLDAGMLLVMVATLGLSWVMLKARTFGRVGPAAGIVAGLVGLSYYLALFAPSSRIFLLEAAGPFYLVWVALAARSVLRLGAVAVYGRHLPDWDVAQP